MDRQTINRISGIVPIVLSLAAFGVVITAVLTGSANGSADEGAAAHIFQLFIVAEVPFILIFVATADWNMVARVAGLIAVQAVALVLAFAPVAFFKL
ncbi:MAG: hypothetical protein M3169_18650 [Candidatus Eremiobacteraeota bacterium]|nr:hypothetical protein [Candidatus Eremiobacteraeota bacterium]